MTDPEVRRAPLQTMPNPAPGLDAVVVLWQTLTDGHSLRLRYIPDRCILPVPAWQAYGALLQTLPVTATEGLAATALSDLANQLVPRWLELTVSAPRECGAPHSDVGQSGHRVRLEETQPGWRNPPLLARLYQDGAAWEATQ